MDVLLENGDYAMPVEIKPELTTEDVDDHIKRIEKVREQLDKQGGGEEAGRAVRELYRPEMVKRPRR